MSQYERKGIGKNDKDFEKKHEQKEIRKIVLFLDFKKLY